MKAARNVKKIFACATAAAISLSAVSCSSADIHTHIDVPTQISFSWWGGDLRAEYTIAAITNYEKQNPNIDISPYYSDFSGYKENLDALYASGKESDVIQINYSWLTQYSPDGEGFYDLNQLSDYINLSNFSEDELSYGTVNGKLNAIPISFNAVTFFYNQKLFDSYGLEIPKTWDDLFSCAETLSADGIYLLDTSEVFRWFTLVAHEEQTSDKAFFTDGVCGFDEENFASMMKFYKLMIDKMVFPYNDVYDKLDFYEERNAGQVRWVSDAESYIVPLETEYDGKVAVGSYITEPGCTRSGWYSKPTSLYAISTECKNPEEAAEFLNYMLNDETVAELQGIEKGVPLSRSALETLSANNRLSGTTYEAARQIADSETSLSQMPVELENSDKYEDFFAKFDLYYYGQLTAEEAAAEYFANYKE